MDVSEPTTKPTRSLRNTVGGRGAPFKNKQWVGVNGVRSHSGSPAPAEGRWERGGYRGGRGRGGVFNDHREHMGSSANVVDSVLEAVETDMDKPEDDAPEQTVGRLKTWEELVKAREVDRAKAIREGKMDDPSKPKRLDEAITIVGTCQDMCPEFERYRRERENNLDKWECILGPNGKPTKKVDHAHAVKIYERGQGDKIIPSDLRPPPVLKRTLDYLFNALIPRGGFAETQAFVRDRSRAVRNDFTIQQDKGPIAMECHERCTRYHILSLHLLYGVPTFDRAMEIQQLMNSLLSLKEFYEEEREHYQSGNELEMRIYHRLGLIRDQHDRNDRTPQHIVEDPAFQLISKFRTEVQAASAPITKVSKMVVSPQAMATFGELAAVLKDRGNVVMIYLVACFLENIFGRDTIDDIETIRGHLTVQDIIDGVSHQNEQGDESEVNGEMSDDIISILDDDMEGGEDVELGDSFEEYAVTVEEETPSAEVQSSSPLKTGATEWLINNFGAAPTPPKPATSVFGQLAASSAAAFGTSSTSVFGSATSTFGNSTTAFGSNSPFGVAPSVFGSNVFGGSVFGRTPIQGGPSPEGTSDASNQSTSGAPSHTAESPGRSFSQPEQRAISLGEKPPLSSRDSPDAEVVADSSKQSTPTFQPLTSTPAQRSFNALNPTAPSFIPVFTHGTLSSEQRATQNVSLSSSQTEAPCQGAETDGGQASPTIPGGPGAFALRFPSVQNIIGKNHSPLTIITKQNRKVSAIDSPVAPPPLNRAQPISLPSTPVSATFAGPSTPNASIAPPRLFFNNGAPTPPGHLPILFTSEQSAHKPHAPVPSSSQLHTLAPNHSNGVSKAPLNPSPSNGAKSSSAIKPDSELNRDAVTFAQRSLLIQECFSRWKKKATDVAAWKEACRRSEAYKQKVYRPRVYGASPSSKKRRVSTETPSETPLSKRRIKRKVPDTLQSRTDDELAQRFKENKEEHERRWAKGSFVKVIQEHIRRQFGRRPPNWRLWLCMNPDNDRTAIWLEQKFDVPRSGDWESESVFSISMSSTSALDRFPGLIVFECIPLEDVKDDLERKYHVLDDCSRLRDIITSLPVDRHFMPSLLILNWADAVGRDAPQDILDMADKFRQDQIIEDHRTFTISSLDGNLDQQLAQVMDALHFDVEGKLVEWITLEDLFERVAVLWKRASSAWVDACGTDEQFNWPLYSHVLPTFFKTLDVMTIELVGIWQPKGLPPPPLPCPDVSKIRDAKSTHSALRGWLRSQQPHEGFLGDDLSDLDASEGFQAQAYLDHVCDVALRRIGHLSSSPSEKRAVLKKLLSKLLSQFQGTLDASSSALQNVAKSLPRPTSKRRPSDGDISESCSQFSSPSQSPYNGAKRMKLSTSNSSDYSEPPSPTPSVAPSMAESTSSVVTLAMLRSLTKDVMRNYGGGMNS